MGKTVKTAAKDKIVKSTKVAKSVKTVKTVKADKAKSKNVKTKSLKAQSPTSAKKNISKNSSEKLTAAAKKQKKKTNLLKLCSLMTKYADDANDKEIIKRFKTTITSSINEDISKVSLSNILKKPEDVNMNEFSESIQPYIKHYLFMFNRSMNKNAKRR